MCGIIWAKCKSGPVNKTILKRYEKQKHRGSKGFGYVSINKDGKVQQRVLKEEESEIRHAIKGEARNEMLFHHRYPTSTANLYEAAHPIEVENDSLKYRYYVAHNGVISNSKELYDKHVKLGFGYGTEIRKETRIITRDRQMKETVETKFNDSESLAIELARYVEGQSKSIDTRGTVAFIMQQIDRDTAEIIATFYGRNEGNPLYIERNKHMFILKSDSEHGEEVEANKIFRIDAKDEKVSLFSSVDIGYYYAYKPPKTDYTSIYAKKEREDIDYDGFGDLESYGFGPSRKEEVKLPMRIDIEAPKERKKLDWSELDSKESAYIYLGEGDRAEHYETLLSDLTMEKKAIQAALRKCAEDIVSLGNVRGNDDYWKLLEERQCYEIEIEDIENRMTDIIQFYYDNQ